MLRPLVPEVVAEVAVEVAAEAEVEAAEVAAAGWTGGPAGSWFSDRGGQLQLFLVLRAASGGRGSPSLRCTSHTARGHRGHRLCHRAGHTLHPVCVGLDRLSFKLCSFTLHSIA
jgi:hypothetical protein